MVELGFVRELDTELNQILEKEQAGCHVHTFENVGFSPVISDKAVRSHFEKFGRENHALFILQECSLVASYSYSD